MNDKIGKGTTTLDMWRIRALKAEAEAQRIEKVLEFTRQWYAVRIRRLEDLAKERGCWPEMAAIIANGTAAGTEPPTYAVQLQRALWRAETAEKEAEGLRKGASAQNEEVCQRLGRALGYPWFKDDQVNFPGSTEEHGVCVGEHVAESIAEEAAREIERLRRGIQDYLDGNYPNPRGHRPGACPHGAPYYDECPSCNAEHFTALLNPGVSPCKPEGD